MNRNCGYSFGFKCFTRFPSLRPEHKCDAEASLMMKKMFNTFNRLQGTGSLSDLMRQSCFSLWNTYLLLALHTGEHSTVLFSLSHEVLRSVCISRLAYTPNDIFLGLKIGNNTIMTTSDKEIGKCLFNSCSALDIVLFILNIWL